MSTKHITHTEHVSVPVKNEHGDIVGAMGICDVSITFLEIDKKYFKIVLKFPNGSFRQLFVNESALIPAGGRARDVLYFDDVLKE